MPELTKIKLINPSGRTGSASNRGKKKKRKAADLQPQLVLGGFSRGLFKDVQPTIVGTEDMDVPTFIRKHVTVDK